MPRTDRAASTGLWLTGGGLLILVVRQLLSMWDLALSSDSVLAIAGTIAGYVMLGGGIFLWCGAAATPRRPMSQPAALQSSPHVEAAAHAVQRFNEWTAVRDPNADLWGSFDQILREILRDATGAARVRTLRPGAGGQQSPAGAGADAAGPSWPALVEYCAENPVYFDAAETAAAPPDAVERHWPWLWNIRSQGQTLGVIAVGELPADRAHETRPRRLIAQLVTTFWLDVCRLEQVEALSKLDRATGVLTRHEFFNAAQVAAEAAQQEREPIVLAVLAIEGVRGLDDGGLWSERDALVERIGAAVLQRVRSDDLTGRFSDDRLVILLRRIDLNLAHLIIEKMVARVNQRINAQLPELAARIEIRAGLAGSGSDQPSLKTLLTRALGAAEQARDNNLAVHEASDTVGVPA